jgi:cytidyltransferase-like protein
MEKEIPVPDELKAKIIKRILGSKEIGLAALKKEFSSLPPEVTEKIISMIKEPGFVLSDAIRPIEEIVHDFSVEMLKTLESAFVIDNKKEVLRLRNELARAISAIESSGSEEAMSILKKQMEKLKSIENVSTAAEGFVFAYDGHSYKFTGNFAPMNQLLGLFKYGRGNVPPLQKLDEALLIEILSEESRSIAIFPGSFKPPHKGHMAVVEHLADQFDKVLVFVSAPVSPKSIRSNLKASDAVSIFNIYISEAGLSDKAMAVVSPSAAPINAAFEFAEKENFDPPASISFVASEKDANRFSQAALDKTRAKNPTLVSLDSVTLPAITGPQGAVSARQLRAIISDPGMDREEKEEALISYLPAYLSESAREMVFNILMPEETFEFELPTGVEEVEIQETSGMGVGSVAGFAGRIEDQ